MVIIWPTHMVFSIPTWSLPAATRTRTRARRYTRDILMVSEQQEFVGLICSQKVAALD
ncbi:MAG TPA: hypothetical protein VE643_06340 [Nitrososphaeraceae archaeon]|nr:hypothetical protein [Nitrososphaeraceae archaeon]